MIFMKFAISNELLSELSDKKKKREKHSNLCKTNTHCYGQEIE